MTDGIHSMHSLIKQSVIKVCMQITLMLIGEWDVNIEWWILMEIRFLYRLDWIHNIWIISIFDCP